MIVISYILFIVGIIGYVMCIIGIFMNKWMDWKL